MYTALHRALGIEPCPLTMELVRKAVADRVAEREDLDWKKVLPKHPGPWVEEFSKDIAAMANAGGGMIVYGVAEEGAEAAEICGVGDVTDGTIRELRGAAYSGTTPPVLGLQTFVIAEGGVNVLAILIPPSDDSPHLVFRQDLFGAPLRLGTRTGWMSERLIESAYRQRFADRDRRSADLDELFDECAMPFLQAPRVWMVAVARPEVTGRRRRIESESARRIFAEASQNTPIPLTSMSPLGHLDRWMRDPILGLRRWTVQTNHFNIDQVYGCRMSVHFDGSVTAALAVAGDRGTDNRSEVHIDDVESVLIDIAGLAISASRELSIMGGFAIKASLVREGSDPISLMEPPSDPRFGGFSDRRPSPLTGCIPVTGVIPTDQGPDPVIEGLREIALDLFSQAASETVQLLKLPDPQEQ